MLKIGFIILLPRMTVSFSIDLIVDEWEVWETVVAQPEHPALPATEARGTRAGKQAVFMHTFLPQSPQPNFLGL